MNEIWEAVLQALERGERLALITGVRSVGSTPRHSAARLVVLNDGRTLGSIGGGTMELQAVAEARAAQQVNQPRLIEYNLIGRGEGNVGLCGGTQEVFIDLLEPSGVPVKQLRALCAGLNAGEPVVFASLVRSEGTQELSLGARCVIRLGGETIGSLGDARLDRAVMEQARLVMAQHYPQRLGFDPTSGAIQRLSASRRAEVEVFLDGIEPRPRLVIVGAGHIGAALARQGKFLGWRVEVVDDRADFLTAEALPDADVRQWVGYDPDAERLGPLNLQITPGTAVVVTTWGWDEPALRQLAGSPAFYVGLVASLRKAAVIFEALRREGIDGEWLERVRVPVGLDLGAESPEEIALAIMAEILAVGRGKTGKPLREVRGDRITSLARVPAAAIPASLAGR
jgi:xanthine dehydrogenase accessory factor